MLGVGTAISGKGSVDLQGVEKKTAASSLPS
jgi:hypothetical protein